MKLRIKGNSLRLRVSRSEVAKLLKGQRVEETIHFAPQSAAPLSYALEQAISNHADGTIHGRRSYGLDTRRSGNYLVPY